MFVKHEAGGVKSVVRAGNEWLLTPPVIEVTLILEYEFVNL